MGVTWIVGVLIVDVMELLPLAYVYTIMVAFQGFWIFLFFVLLEEKVRQSYVKVCKSRIRESTLFSRKSTLSTNNSNSNNIMVRIFYSAILVSIIIRTITAIRTSWILYFEESIDPWKDELQEETESRITGKNSLKTEVYIQSYVYYSPVVQLFSYVCT